MKRRTSLPVQVGNLTIGGTAPVSVQTMSTVNPAYEDKAIADVKRLASYGAELVRFAVPDMAAAEAMKTICANSPIFTLITDWH